MTKSVRVRETCPCPNRRLCSWTRICLRTHARNRVGGTSRVCVRGHVSMTVQVAVDTSQCPCPVRVYGHGSVLIVFLSWTRVPVRVRGHVLW